MTKINKNNHKISKNTFQNTFSSNFSKVSNSLVKSLTVLSLFGLTLTTFSLATLAQSAPTAATTNPQTAAGGGLGIMPSTSDPKNTQTKGWFIENIEAGKSVSRSANVINQHKEDKDVEIRAKDSIQTRDGGWDFLDNSSKDEFLGSWIKLEKDVINVKSGKGAGIKFDINVPKDAKSGEYGAVIATQLPTVANNRGVAIENRVGSRVYLTVPGDLKMSTKMDKFEFLSPKSQNYNQSNSDKVAMQVNFENAGNIFTKSFGKVTITTPKGTITQVVDRDLAPRQSAFLFNFATSEEWMPGKYKAKIELNNRPLINNKGQITDSSPVKTLETEIDLTQEIIDTIKKDRQNPAGIVPQIANNNAPSTFEIGGSNEEVKTAQVGTGKNTDESKIKIEEKTEEKTEEKQDSMMPILIGGGVLGVIIIVLLVSLLMKKGKKDEVEKVEVKSVKSVSSVNSNPKTPEVVQVETVNTEKEVVKEELEQE